MAERADGSIVVDVDLDAEGFKAGSAQLQRAVKSFSAQAEKLGPAFQKAMSGNMDAIAAFNGKAQLLESTMANVRKEMLASADKLVDTQESEALASAAEKAEQEQAQLQKSIAGTQEKLEKAKISAQGYYDEVAKAQASTDAMLKNADTGEQVDRILEIEKQELDQIEKKYASQIGKVKELTASLEGQKQKQAELTRQAEEFKAQSQQAMKPFSQTEWYGQISRSLKQASAELANMKGEAQRAGEELAKGGTKAQETTRQSASSMEKLSKKSKEASGHVDKTASAGGKLASHLRKALGYVGRMVSGLLRMAFHSRDTSQGMQGLLSSIKRLTPALLMAEGVMGLLRKAVSAYMQENQQMANTLNACWSSIGNMLGPIIERLVNLVALASAYFTRFLQLLGFVGKSTSKAISTAGGAASSASKKLEKQLASFDELNILSDHGAGSGGGGAGTGDLAAGLPEVELPDWAKLIAKQLKEGDWGGAGKTLGEAFNRFIDDFDWAGWGSRLGGAVQKGLDFALGFLRTTNWVGLGAGGATFLNSFLASVDPNDVGALLASKLNVAIKLAYGFVTTFKWPEFGIWLAGVVMGWFNEIDWAMAGKTFGEGIIGLLDAARHFFETADWKDIGSKVGEFFKNIEWGDIWSGLWDTAIAAGGALMDFLDGLHDGLGDLLPIIGAVGAAFAAWKIGSGITGALDKIFGLFGKGAGIGGGGFQIPSPGTVLKGLADLTLIIGGVIGLIEALGALNQIPGFAETAQSGLAALKQVFGGIAETALPLAGMAAAVTALGKVGISSVLQGMGGMALILDGIPAVIVALGALLSVPGFSGFLSTGVRSLQECFNGLGKVAGPLGAMAAVVVGLGFASPGVVLSGLGGFALVIGGLEAVLVALGALNQIPGFSWIVGEGGKALMQLGEILGGFAGSIVNGLLKTATDGLPQVADNISGFAQNLKPFISVMGQVDPGIGTAAKILADAVICLCGANLINGVTSWLTGGTSLADFGRQIAVFGSAFKQYYTAVKGIDTGVVTSTAAAADSLTKLANTVPPTGGLMGWLLGRKDLGTFGEQLVAFGKGFASYAASVSTVQAGVVTASAAAAQSLTELARNVPTSGGFFSLFTGNNSIDSFGASLAAFGKYFRQYYDHIAGINAKAITGTTEAIGGLLSMAKQAQGVDTKGLSAFGQAIADFGKKLSGTAWLTVSGDFSAGVANMASATQESAASMGQSMKEITLGWQDTRKAVGKENDGIKQDTTTKWNAVKNALNTAFTSIKQNAKTSASQVKTNVQTAWNQISTNTTSKWNSIRNTVSNNTSSIKSTVNSGFESARASIVNKMTSAMRSISGQNWQQVGSGICSGIAAGLNNNWWWLSQTVANLSYSLLATSKAALGIHSPSVLFKKIIGLNIGYGVGEGIADSQPAILKSVTGVAGAIAEGFKAQEYAVQPIPVDKASGLPRALDGFSDTITDSFAGLLDRLEAIARRVTFTMPAVAGTVVPYGVKSPGTDRDSKAAETIEASNEELGSIVIQVVSQAAAAIVRAIEDNSGGSGPIDKARLLRALKDDISKETKMRGKSPLPV